MAQEALPQEIDVHVDPDPIPNPSRRIISSAKLTLNPAHRHNEPGLVGIDWPRESDTQLHDFCARKLAQPGWAGLVSLEEAEYIRRRLEADAKLRRRWHIQRKKVPFSLVAERSYPDDPEAARRHIKAQQAQAGPTQGFSGTRIMIPSRSVPIASISSCPVMILILALRLGRFILPFSSQILIMTLSPRFSAL